MVYAALFMAFGMPEVCFVADILSSLFCSLTFVGIVTRAVGSRARRALNHTTGTAGLVGAVTPGDHNVRGEFARSSEQFAKTGAAIERGAAKTGAAIERGAAAVKDFVAKLAED